jgi:hypothetical protein
MRHHRDRVVQPVLTQPGRAQVPEERAQRRRREFHRPGPVAARQDNDKLDHVTGADLRDVQRAVGERRLQERPGEPGVVASSPRTHAAGAAQMHVEAGEHVLQRQSITRCHQLCSLSSEPIGGKKRRDYVQLRRAPASVEPSQDNILREFTLPNCT